MAQANENYDFDLRLAKECAQAYSSSSGLGCTISDTVGRVLFETGSGYSGCQLCELSGLANDSCFRSQAYGMAEAERFGGRYIYFCPMGLTCIVTTVMGPDGCAARITAGPFLMVDREDYVAFDLEERLKLDEAVIERVLALTDKLPCIPPDKVNALAILLFMAVGFMNHASASSRLLEIRDSSEMQGQISQYLMALKNEEKTPGYPISTEKALLSSIVDSDKAEAGKLLNELLGYILFSSGGNFSEIKLRIYELLALIARTAVDVGAPADDAFRMNHEFYKKASVCTGVDEFCNLLAGLINGYIDTLFLFPAAKNTDVINKAVHFMRRRCTQKIALEDVASTIYLSPTYFSKLFKQETGHSFNAYLNKLRIEKSKRMLLQTELRLVDIAGLSGFEDQSYFTKVFKRVTGVSPNNYRKSGGRCRPVNNKM